MRYNVSASSDKTSRWRLATLELLPTSADREAQQRGWNKFKLTGLMTC